MASFLVLCQRCSAKVRFMAAPDLETRVYCDSCWDWIGDAGDKATEGKDMAEETLKERLARKKPTKASWEVSEPRPLVEGTPLEKKK